MRIFLIQPNAKATFKSPPLGLMMLATVLDQNGYTDIVDIDQNKGDDPYLFDYTGDNVIVGLSVTFMTIMESYELAAYVKKQNPKAVVIFGGPHATLMPEECFDSFNVDILVLGEGEYTMLEIVKALENKSSLDGIKGLWYRDADGQIIKNERRDFLKDLGELPYPNRKFFNDAKYQKDEEEVVYNVIATQSCPFNCTMCQPALKDIAGPYRKRPINHVIDELNYLKENYGARRINFYDNDLGLSKKWITEFCIAVKEQAKGLQMSCCGRANILTYEVLKLMKEAGFSHLSFGAESGNNRVLNDIMDKKTTVDQIRDFAVNCNKLKINCASFWMLASPGETIEEMKDTAHLAASLPVVYAHFHIATPNPGTKYYLDAVAGGYLKMDNWNDVDDRRKPTIIKDNVTREEVAQMDGYLIEVMEKNGFKHSYNGHTLAFVNEKYNHDMVNKDIVKEALKHPLKAIKFAVTNPIKTVNFVKEKVGI